MDFRSATDLLFEKVGHEDLAKMLGTSVASIRQARLNEDARAKRAPPNGWEKAVMKLAEERVAVFADLVRRLKAEERPRAQPASGRSPGSARPAATNT